jgi:Fic family protein
LNDYHNGKIEKWLDFYLDGVITVAKEAIETVQQITTLRYEDMLKIQTLNKTASESAIKVLPYLFALPIVKISTIQEWTGFSRQGSQNVIDRLVDIGILEIKDTVQTYGKSYIYRRYIDIFNKN